MEVNAAGTLGTQEREKAVTVTLVTGQTKRRTILTKTSTRKKLLGGIDKHGERQGQQERSYVRGWLRETNNNAGHIRSAYTSSQLLTYEKATQVN